MIDEAGRIPYPACHIDALGIKGGAITNKRKGASI